MIDNSVHVWAPRSGLGSEESNMEKRRSIYSNLTGLHHGNRLEKEKKTKGVAYISFTFSQGVDVLSADYVQSIIGVVLKLLILFVYLLL